MRIQGFIVSLLLLSGLPVSAQMKLVPKEKLQSVASPRLSRDSASLKFDTRHIVAPKMSEDDAPAVFTYRLSNVGESPLEIKALRTTCSCVAATSGKHRLDPGDNTVITVRYAPKGHPGRFERRIFVYTDDGTDPSAVLKLSVDVEAGSDLSGEWPVQMGQIRLRRDNVRFKDGSKAVEKIRFINLGEKPLALDCERMFLPGCLGFETRPASVPPGGEGEIVIAFDPAGGQQRPEMKIILKGLGLPPTRSTVKVNVE